MRLVPLLLLMFFVFVFADAAEDDVSDIDEDDASDAASDDERAPAVAKDYFTNDPYDVLLPNKEKLDECFKKRAGTDRVNTLMGKCNPDLSLPITVDSIQGFHRDSSLQTISEGLQCEMENYPVEDSDGLIWGLQSAVQICLESVGVQNLGMY